jgi:hypothetical protein
MFFLIPCFVTAYLRHNSLHSTASAALATEAKGIDTYSESLSPEEHHARPHMYEAPLSLGV